MLLPKRPQCIFANQFGPFKLNTTLVPATQHFKGTDNITAMIGRQQPHESCMTMQRKRSVKVVSVGLQIASFSSVYRTLNDRYRISSVLLHEKFENKDFLRAALFSLLDNGRRFSYPACLDDMYSRQVLRVQKKLCPLYFWYM